MDASRFDRLARALVGSGGRRPFVGGLLAAAGALLVALVGGLDVEGDKRKRRERGGRGRPARESAVAAERKKKKKRCKPKCAGKVCGSNGCKGGTCGTCSASTRCNAAGQCVGCLSAGDCVALPCNSVSCAQSGTCVYQQAANGTACGGADTCQDGLCCTVCAAGCAFTSIQAAVDAASPGDTVTLCPGTYRQRVAIPKHLTLTGLGADPGETVISNPAPPTIDVPASVTVTLRNLTVTGAVPDQAFTAPITTAGATTLDRVEVSGNQLSDFNDRVGGAILNTGTLSLIDSRIVNNRAVRGGGIANIGDATLTRSVVQGNIAAQGGGVINFSFRTLTLNDNSKIRSNLATGGAGSGGGVRNEGGFIVVDGSSAIARNTPENCASTTDGERGCPV